MIFFTLLKYKNLLASGNYWTEIDLRSKKNTLTVGQNGSGKCLCINTPIRLKNSITSEIIETTIGELYESESKKKQNSE